jgi:predicted RNA-binding protein YlxR (DUF448 family)
MASQDPDAGEVPFATPPRAAHVAERTCAGCGLKAARPTLLRIGLATPGDALEWRARGGRGTYLHDSEQCRRRFVQGKKRLPGLRAAVGRAARQALVDRTTVAR